MVCACSNFGVSNQHIYRNDSQTYELKKGPKTLGEVLGPRKTYVGPDLTKGKIMAQETLTVYLCPYCEKNDIICYKKRVYKSEKPDFEFSYLGLCCDYYPHENPVVDDALTRLVPKRSLVPRDYTTGKIGESKDKKRLFSEC